MKSVKEYLEENRIAFSENEPMSRHTTFKIGGKVAYFCEPADVNEIVGLVKFLKSSKTEYLIVGKGSNLLFTDDDSDKVIVCTDKFVRTDMISDTEFKCTSGVPLNLICKYALYNSLTGLEFAYGIPGNCGGAVFMNAGAYGGEMKDVIESVEYLDENGDIKTVAGADACFGYRSSMFKQNPKTVILSATFLLKKGNSSDIESRMRELLQKRKDKQPLEYPSAGSAFKRPEGYFAGSLIEECGLKGYNVGGAQVSEKHAGFIINTGTATALEVTELVEYIRDTVYKQKGVVLEPEIRIIG